MVLDWNSIRPLNGGRDKGFEELCAQLASAESPDGSRFVRKGSPDAGVECYTILPDSSEWGWQSKYFDSLGDSQWSQIDESIKTALEKHPKLVRYYVCLPFDFADARTTGRKSAKDRWDEHVEKWRKWGSDRPRQVEFVYWGSHELLDRLARPQHIGRTRFWFEARYFDSAWFKARLDEALLTAGPRYTPEVHIDLPIAQQFEAFGRTDAFFNRERSHARRIRKGLSGRRPAGQAAADAQIDNAESGVLSTVQTVLAALGAIDALPIGPLPFKEISQQIQSAERATAELITILGAREHELDAELDATGENASERSYPRNPFRDRRRQFLELEMELREGRESLVRADEIASNTLLIVRGAAGTGKTHLLCDIAQRRIAAGYPTILLMGQQFVSSDAPWPQALQQLDLPGMSAEEFVGALEA